VSTRIEWTDETWNPVTGCTKVSAGCKNCYAERIADRLWGYQYGRWGSPRKFTDVQCHPDRLDQPLRWRKPRRIFVCSMSDLFHEGVPEEFIDRVFAVAALCPQHTLQILTKRSDRMAEYSQRRLRYPGGIWDSYIKAGGFRGDAEAGWPLPNVHLGVSIEDTDHRSRLGYLLETPAAHRFLSLEPLLGPLPGLNLKGIHWVIVGGESGPGARPCNVEWIRSVVEQCKAADVPVFVKQDSGPKPGMQGRIPNDLWALKEMPA
jgi:protein gp37